MVIYYVCQELQIGESMMIESILGIVFEGKVVEIFEFGLYLVVILEVQGMVYVIGQYEFLINFKDFLKDGFILRQSCNVE